jgi:hypothetical protein
MDSLHEEGFGGDGARDELVMTCTHPCARWAQWKVTAPEKDGDGKIFRFKTVAVLCGEHRNAMKKSAEESDPPIDLRFNFVGAVPNGHFDPQS